MKAILIDDERYSLNYLEKQCAGIEGLEILGKFQNAVEALAFLEENEVELVLTDIEMPGFTGLEAVRKIRRLRPDTGILFVTGYEQYALEAFQLDAVSYLMKPCHREEVERAVLKAGRLMAPYDRRTQIRTFGHFSVLVEGEPLRFSSAKAKELLALLVDRRGDVVTMEQATGILWESRPYDNMVKQLYRKVVSSLRQLFSKYRLDFFLTNRGSCHILPTRVDCDYYRLLEGDETAIRGYNGEYMLDYGWAEPTVAKIERLLAKE